jgi:Uncharacterised MFS-type transporter YbfB
MLTGMQRRGGTMWLVAPGLATIAVTYGLARLAYGLFLPEMRESLDLSDSVLGLIGAGSYAGYCLAVGARRSIPSGKSMPAIRSAIDLTRFPPYSSTNFRDSGLGEVRRRHVPHA